MMAEYEGLADWLSGQHGPQITVSFGELDQLVSSLPSSARADRTWWGNTTNRRRVQSHAWLGAGWQVDQVNLLEEQLSFVRLAVRSIDG